MPRQYIDNENLALVRARLWERAQAKGITLEDIEDRTGFSFSQVYRIIRGDKNVSISHIFAVCKALEIQPRDIFDFDVTIPKYFPLRKNRK